MYKTLCSLSVMHCSLFKDGLYGMQSHIMHLELLGEMKKRTSLGTSIPSKWGTSKQSPQLKMFIFISSPYWTNHVPNRLVPVENTNVGVDEPTVDIIVSILDTI